MQGEDLTKIGQKTKELVWDLFLQVDLLNSIMEKYLQKKTNMQD